MSRRGAALLLLALGACAVASAEVAYSLTIADPSGPSYVGYPQDLSGSLMSDEDCPPPPPPAAGKVTSKVAGANTFCKPVPDTTVTIRLEEGVGELSQVPSRRMSVVKPKGPATPSKPASSTAKKPATKAVAELQATTDMDGKFTFRLSSAAVGDSILSAGTELDGGVVSTLSNTTISWSNPKYTVWADQETASDTVSYNHTLKFTLLLGQPPSRQASLPSKSPKVPSKAPKALETPYDLPPVADATFTFYRIDHNTSNVGRAAGNKLNTPKAPSSTKDTKARVKADWTEFGSGVTDANGVVNVEVPSPGFAGQTEVLVSYFDAQGTEWTGYATITWSDPVIPSVVVTNNITSNLVPQQPTTISAIIVDAAGSPVENVPVTFNVAGLAYLVETPQRKAPGIREVVNKVVYTDVEGRASILINSDTDSINTINISYDINGRIFTIDPFTMIWGAPPADDFTTIKLAPKRLDVRVGRAANLTATVTTDAGVGVEGVRVRFTLTPARVFNNAEAHLEADEGVIGTTASAEVATHFREAVTDAQGEAKITLNGLLPGRFKVVASATNTAGTLVSSEPAFVSWYGKGNSGNYGHKKHHNNNYDKDSKKYKEGQHRKQEGDHDKKGSYKRPHTDY